MPDSRVIRAFIAINLPDDVRANLARLARELESALPGNGVRWVRPEQVHLTLKFLGDIAVDSVADLKDAIRCACRNIEPCSLRGEGLGVFPTEQKPRVIWAGLGGDREMVQRLQEQLESETARWRAREEREFHPHLTLARVKHLNPMQTEILGNKLGERKNAGFGEWQTEKLELMQSTLTATGALYSSLAEFGLPG
jgi:RNA 2',3'-cyclic 3'-phosphodiesterase